MAARPLRLSCVRWRTLATLVAALDRCVIAAARLDAYEPHRPGFCSRPQAAARVDRQIRGLRGRLVKEVNRVTREQLHSDLARRQQTTTAAAYAA